MSAAGASGRAFAQYADLMDQALRWRAERDEAIAENKRLREALHAALVIAEDDTTHPDADAALDLMAEGLREALREAERESGPGS